MTVVQMEFEFCYMHRLMHHQGKCANLHGHNGKAHVFVRGKVDQNTGMVIDFADLKRLIGGWIDERLDHNAILNPDDEKVIGVARDVGEKVPYLMPVSRPEPTAENLAWVIHNVAERSLDRFSTLNVEVIQVTVQETAKCSAHYYAEGNK
jgi:6-pyruvoyltetrahydropterin/6-carboxytetrahydropterin synthase